MLNKEQAYIVISPNYEILRYGHDLIKRQTADAHAVGKLSKFIIGLDDLIDPKKPPTPDNFKFEARQAEEADIIIYVDRNKKLTTEQSDVPWGRWKRRSNRIKNET